MQTDGDIRPEHVFARRTRELRDRLGISQVQLATTLAARGVRIDPTSITRLERGTRGIRLNEAVAIARAFGQTVDEMLRPALPPAEQLSEAERQADLARWRAAQAVAEMEAARDRVDRLRAALDAPNELRED